MRDARVSSVMTSREKTGSDRRTVLGMIGIAGVAAWLWQGDAADARPGGFAVTKSDAAWRKELGNARYRILRQAGTEVPFTSPLNKEHRKGVFVCAGCAQPLFSSATKFDSGTGWPSFWKPLGGAVVTRRDRTFGMVRDEVLCARCGGHLGHVFDDGPKPTGLRYCMNGLAMRFRPA